MTRSKTAAMPAVLTPAAGSPTPSSTPAPFVAASTQPPYQPPGPTGPGGWGPGGPAGWNPGGPGAPGGPGGPGGPPWQPPPFGPPGGPPKRNWAPIIAAVVVFVLVLGGAITAVVLMNRSGSDDATASGTTTSSTTTRTTTTTRTRTTTTTPADTGASARLMSLLPAGYEPGACNPVDPAIDALATVDCEQNSKTGGPQAARYALYPDQATLDRRFDAAVGNEEEIKQDCPGSDLPSPTTWYYTSTPDKVAGRVSCSTFQGTPGILWTENEKVIMALGRGPDMVALHKWWLEFG